MAVCDMGCNSKHEQLNAVTRHEESSSIYCIPPVPSSPISSLSIDVQDHQHNWGVHGNGLGWSRFQPPPLHACEPCKFLSTLKSTMLKILIDCYPEMIVGESLSYFLEIVITRLQVVGACWYMLAVEQQQKCWAGVCNSEPSCQRVFLDCFSLTNPDRNTWSQSTTLASNCTSAQFNYGIYSNAIDNDITSTKFITRYFYSLWLGLLALR